MTYPVGQGLRQSTGGPGEPGLGRPLRLQVWLRRGPLGPAWVALCGALASGGLVLAGEPLLRLALLVFLVDLVWGGLWSALLATDWATPLGRWQNWDQGPPLRLLPYTTPDAPAGRLARTLGHLWSWWAEVGRPALGPTLSGLVVLLPLALVGAGILSAPVLLLTLAAVALLQLTFAWSGGDARPVPGPQALFEVGLPWLAGHALFRPLTVPSLLLALGYALAYAGGLRLGQNGSGLARWNLGQIVAVAVLVVWHQHLAAGGAGLLLLGQAVVQPGLFDPQSGELEPAAVPRFLRLGQPWLMAAMLVAAWGARAISAGG